MMFQLGGLKAGEEVFDLARGDGRMATAAARKFHAGAVGTEVDPDLCRQSLATVCLTPATIDNEVRPPLDRQIEQGARVVAHGCAFRGWTAEKVENIAGRGEGRSRTLYLYRN